MVATHPRHRRDSPVDFYAQVNNLKTFNSTICAFIESIAADEVNDGTDGPPPPAPPRSGKMKRRARRVLQQPVADSPAWR
jgi:hypothetical protein